jgi:hypothetical protein
MTGTGTEGTGVYDTIHAAGTLIIRGAGELSLIELRGIAREAAQARREGRRVLVDLRRVQHLHYAGAAFLRSATGVRVVGASPYVRDLMLAGGAGGFVELYDDVEEALRAA